MYKLSRTRIFLILAICVIGIFFAIPNMMNPLNRSEERRVGKECRL